jgi:hypothetical protein
MEGNVAAAATVVLLMLVLVGMQRVLPRHDVAVPICWAVAVFVAWKSLDSFREFMTSHTTGLLVGVALGLTITISADRRDRHEPHEPFTPPRRS